MQGANLWEEVEPANAKVATKFLFFLFFSFSLVFLDGVTKVICSISALGLCDLYWTYRYDAAYAFKPCTLEIKRNGRFKGVYVECCSSTTKNIYLQYNILVMVTYQNELPPTKQHDQMIKWPCEIAWQTKNITSSLPEWLWPPIILRWWLTLRDYHP